MRHSTTRKRRRALALLAVGLLIPLGACSDDDEDDDAGDDTTTTAPTGDTATDDTGVAGGATLTIEGFAFGEVTAAAGSDITITNADGAPHTVTSDDDAWEVVRVEGGAEGQLTAPSEAGEYAYHCDIHQSMTGTLVVE